MLFCTGDTHGNPRRLNTKNFPQQHNMTKDDLVIILGDAGLIWDMYPSGEELYWLKWLNKKPFTTCYLRGNHENHPRLDALPWDSINGFGARRVSDSVFVLESGVYSFDDINFFVAGGAHSTDIVYRTEGKTWWPEEVPSMQQRDKMVHTLENVGDKIDFVLSHEMPAHIVGQMPYIPDEYSRFLSIFVDDMTPNKLGWYGGHYHVNRTYEDSYHILYDSIIRLG